VTTAGVARAREDEEFFTRERCWILELWNTPADLEVSIARCRVEPTVTTERHVLSVAERYVVLSGHGSVEVGDALPEPVSPGDAVWVPPGTAQRISNAGPEDLVFLAICSPRFEPHVYQPLPERDGRP